MKKRFSISLKTEVTIVIVISLTIFSMVSAAIFQRFSSFSSNIGNEAAKLKVMQNQVSKISEINQTLQFLVLNSTAGNATKEEKEKAFTEIQERQKLVQANLLQINNGDFTKNFESYNELLSKSVELLKGGDSLTAADIALTKLPAQYNALINVGNNALNNTIKSFDLSISNLDKFILVSVFILLGLFLVFSVSSYYIVKKILMPVYTAKVQLVAAIDEVSHAAQTTQKDATEVGSGGNIFANSCHEIATSMEELKTMVNNNAKSTHESSQFAEQSAKASEKAQNVVNELNDSMGNVEKSIVDFIDTINDSVIKLNGLAVKINEIADKTNLINDIVFQTRLLSFNASVEAARAGEQGKGFAVVADEVGKLAAMSGSSAQEIQTLVQDGVQVAKTLVEEITNKVTTVSATVKSSVETGSRHVSTTVQILDQVATNMQNLRTFMENIDKASKEQEVGIKRVSELVVKLSETATQNNAVSENMQKNASLLIQNSEQLFDVTSTINLVLEGNSSNEGAESHLVYDNSHTSSDKQQSFQP